MAIGILAVLAIVLAVALQYTSSGARHAARSNADQKAYALAEAGINNALSILYTHTSPTASPNVGQAALQTSLSGGSPGPGGHVTWSGTPSFSDKLAPGGQGTWTITATGTVANPTGPAAADVTRTLKRTVSVTAQPASSPTLWNRIYSNHTGSACDLTVKATMNNPVSAKGNVCLGIAPTGSGATLTYHPGLLVQTPIVIGGNLCVGSACAGKVTDTSGSSCIGALASPGTNPPSCSLTQTLDSDQVSIGGLAGVTSKCQYGSAPLHALPCTRTDHVYTSNNATRSVPDATTLYLPKIQCPDDPAACAAAKPVILKGASTTDKAPWVYWYNHAAPGPVHGCTPGASSGTLPVFDTNAAIDGSAPDANLTPVTGSYQCRVCPVGMTTCTSTQAVGELSWTRNKDMTPNPSPTPPIAQAAKSGTTVTLTLASPGTVGMSVGDFIKVVDVPIAGYNGTYEIATIAGNALTYTTPTNTALAHSSGGTVSDFRWGVSGILKIKGTIFIDGSWVGVQTGASSTAPENIGNTNQNIDYNGTGSLFLTDIFKFGAEKAPNLCAGGDGTYGCQWSSRAFSYGPPTDPPSDVNRWDPTTNMLTVYAGGIGGATEPIEMRSDGGTTSGGLPGSGGAYMGQFWTPGGCRQEGAPWLRASLNCGNINMVPAQSVGGVPVNYYFQFPPTSILQPPQEGIPGGISYFELQLGGQSG